ncbi:MAG: LytTR family transcriptional regulator, partial [Alphaproteobacteria bacterium]|nr:LytTR family transcriptional regulator [Alphaproteobacteria bacterium]
MFSFAAPLALFGLLSLPLIYWLLQVTPPRPREIVFPPTKILRELKPDDETPAKTPWWLVTLRLALAAALIFAMAGPVWAPSGVVASAAPTLIVIDDGWPAAPTWERRIAGAQSLIEAAARAGGPVAVALASESAAPALGDGPRALEKLRPARPKPFLPERKPIGEQVAAFARAHPTARIVWISDGLAQGDAAGFARALKESGASGVEVYVEDHAPRALVAPTNDAAALSVDVLRAGGEESTVVEALDAKGRTIGRAAAQFGAASRVRAKIELPVELRNEVSHLRIEGENSAGAVALLDARSKVKRVALVGGEGADEAQPLLSPLYYLEKALAPFAQVRTARPGVVDPVQALLAENPNIMALADVGLAPGETFDALSRFVDEGG